MRFFFEHSNDHRVSRASSTDRNESSDGDVEWRPSESRRKPVSNCCVVCLLRRRTLVGRDICLNSFSSHFRCQHDLSIRQLYVRFVSPFDLSMHLLVFGRHCAHGSASSNRTNSCYSWTLFSACWGKSRLSCKENNMCVTSTVCIVSLSHSIHKQNSPFVHHTPHYVYTNWLSHSRHRLSIVKMMQKNLSSTVLTSSALLSIDNCQGYSVSFALHDTKYFLFVLFDDWWCDATLYNVLSCCCCWPRYRQQLLFIFGASS